MHHKMVIYHRDSDFKKQMIQLRQAGGRASKAYQKIGEIRNSIELGLVPASRYTRNGETRIKNCKKYELGDGYRLVTVEIGNVVSFCFAGSHDDADAWLETNKGLALAISKDHRVSITYEGKERSVLPAAKHPTISDQRLLDSISGFNIEKVFPKRSIRRQFEAFTFQTHEEEILNFLEDVKADEGDELAYYYEELVNACKNSDSENAKLIQGFISGETQIADEEKAPITVKDVRSAVNSEQIVVLSDLSDDEIERLWDPARFDDWMVYLHEGQRRVVDEDYDLPSILGGVSGSGKTCVLLHRAKRLAELYPNEGILILTLNRSLSRLLDRLFKHLTMGCLTNVKVESFHDYVTRLLALVGMETYFQDLGIVYGIDDEINQFLIRAGRQNLDNFFNYRSQTEVKTLWNQYQKDKDSGYKVVTDRFSKYLLERELTLDAHDYMLEEFDLIRSGFLFTEDYKKYYKYERRGRSIGFNETRKREIVDILKGWEKYQFKHGFLDQMTIAQAGLWALEDSNGLLPDKLRYRCVLVDEYQDFSTQELNFISCIPKKKENGLFLTGDAGQKIYAKDFNLPQAGLGPTERIRRDIRKNYRNSRQILEAAHELLESYSGEGTAKAEGITVLKPEYAVRMTAKPFAVDHSDPIACAWIQAEQWIETGSPAFTVAIITADESEHSVEAIISSCPDSTKATELSGDLDQQKDCVIVSDLNSIKGFEFSLVIIVGLSQGQFPRRGTAKGERWRDALRLYVAMTRARDELVMIYTQKPSPFLKVMREKLFQRTVLIEDESPPKAAVPKATDNHLAKKEPKVAQESIKSVLRGVPTQTKLKNKEELKKIPTATSKLDNQKPSHPSLDPSNTNVSSCINGTRIIPIHTPATLKEVAIKIRVPEKRLISIMRTEWEEYIQPQNRLHDGYIHKIFEAIFGWDCVPHLIKQRTDNQNTPINTENIRKKVLIKTSEKTNFSGSTIPRCEVGSCNNIAMPESSYCYDHDSK